MCQNWNVNFGRIESQSEIQTQRGGKNQENGMGNAYECHKGRIK